MSLNEEERKGAYGMKEKIKVVFDIDIGDGFGCCFFSEINYVF